MNLPALIARDLHARLGAVPVVQGVDVQIAAGKWTSIAGPNGAGKSTLLQVLAGYLPHQGQVELLGRPLAGIKPRERAQLLAWLGTANPAADDLSAYDVAMLGRLPHQAWLAAPSAQDRAAVEQAMHTTHTWALRERPLGKLSSGERQRVLLARLFAVQARVLLMDEPLTNLDPPHQADWLRSVRGQTAQGNTVVSVLHDMTMALQADELIVLAQGRVLHHGRCDDPRTHRALEQVFAQRIYVQAAGQSWSAVPAP
jgi:iron complex transport system ATP-binding protein